MKYFALLFLSVFFFTSCGKKNEKKWATLNIEFQTQINGTNCLLSDVFIDSQGRTIKIELLKFYLCDISFIDSKDKTWLAEEIALVEIESTGLGYLSIKVPPGDYHSVNFGIGVKQSLNESDPALYTSADHPLSTTQNTYWGMNSMYRFVMIDGRYDSTSDGTYDGTFSYHTGYNDSYRTTGFDKGFSFKKRENYEAKITLELTNILEGIGGNQDIESVANFHGNLSDIAISYLVSDNFKEALKWN